MYQIEQLQKEKDGIAKIKSTGIFWRMTQADREVIGTIEKKYHKESKPSSGSYSYKLDAIIQDSLR